MVKLVLVWICMVKPTTMQIMVCVYNEYYNNLQEEYKDFNQCLLHF